MTDETNAGPPDELDQIQDSIEEQLDAGATTAAVSELSELRLPDQADVIAVLEESDRQKVLGELSESEIARSIVTCPPQTSPVESWKLGSHEGRQKCQEQKCQEKVTVLRRS